MDANKELDINASLVVLSADCINFEADTAFVQYRVNGGDWTDAPLTLQGDGVEGSILAKISVPLLNTTRRALAGRRSVQSCGFLHQSPQFLREDTLELFAPTSRTLMSSSHMHY